MRGLGDRPTLALVTESMRPLHTGDFAGLWLKLVYLFFGLLLSTLVLSGMMVWTRRSVRATAQVISERRRRPVPAAELGAAE